ncbi:MAG: arginine deiminase-related protein [Bacteroidota bacterium]|nr:arginine deiminase-related protein [Bacteroidota bacterium]
MIYNKIYTSFNIDFTIDEVVSLQQPKYLLMCTPEYFDIVDVKNVHMEGNAGTLNKTLAIQQWNELKDAFLKGVEKNIINEVLEIKGAKDCEDMVFCANQSFPWISANGEKIVILSKMRHQSRQREVPFFKDFYQKLGYKTIDLQKTPLFEGMGDLIYHTGKRLLYGGYGHRTVKEAYNELSELLECPIIALELIDERFYHLDTCFVSLGVDAVMICKEAFSNEGLDALHKMYKRVYYIPVEEAIENFALNAHTMFNLETNKKFCVIHKGASFTKSVLTTEEFEVIEVDTSEYMKSGGSVFCMKMMLF